MRSLIAAAVAILALSISIGLGARAGRPPSDGTNKSAHGLFLVKSAPRALPDKTEVAMFAGGCFWGVEEVFRHEPGVIATAVGFSGGHVKNPSYRQVCAGDTAHAEACMVEFDPKRTNFEKLAKTFFEVHDPTEVNRQGPDEGEQYRSAIFTFNSDQRKTALDLIARLEKSGDFGVQKIATEVRAASPFYFAEDYHQQYVEKGGVAYCHARTHRNFGGK